MNSIATEVVTESPEDKLNQRLCSMIKTYIEPEAVDEVVDAYHFAANAHAGQLRKSGEPFICHPLSVAMILAEMRIDQKGLMAAILHDVVEDTVISIEQVSEVFGEEVAGLVDGVTKLTQLDSKSSAEEAQAENVRKMFLAMARDLRVILVKLADRLHNMRTIGAMAADKRRRIARETLDIYAPLANRLGMNQIRLELEGLGFKSLYPMRYRVLNQEVRERRGRRKEVVSTIESTVKKRLDEAGITSNVVGREKHLHSIYRKMRNKKIPFSEVFDVYAFRILTSDINSCYLVLGTVHNLYKPLPGKFKDYIALPKSNGYQSLHTILVGPYGISIEVQIRTYDMHRMAKSGIAAHWLYKSDGKKSEVNPQARAHEWVRNLLEVHESVGNSLEFIENLKVDLFPQETFVFTPQGEVVKLPRGATVVDFAYSVHTDVGNTCVAARVDRRLIPLQTKLVNGQTVEIITSTWARPNPGWLNYVITAKARAGIRSYLKNFKAKEASSLGRRLLEQELFSLKTKIEDIPLQRIAELLKALDLESLDQLLEEIGLGNRMPFLTARRLCSGIVDTEIVLEDMESVTHAALMIKGTEGTVVSLAKCCHPIPGDPVVGLFNPGTGIVVHLNDCLNIFDNRKKSQGWLDIEWDHSVSGEFSVALDVGMKDQRGSLAMVASAISKAGSNIENFAITSQDGHVTEDLITLSVKDRRHLAEVIRALKNLSVVLSVHRARNKKGGSG